VQLYVFSVEPSLVRDVVVAGAAGIVVDWENRGKECRQQGWGTEINRHTTGDLERVRAATDGRVLCRINGHGPWTAGEVRAAVARGADEILLPMVRRPEEVDRTLDLVDGRCGLGILVETRDAVERATELARRPLSRVYVGLNDLRIDRGATDLFTPLVDGTVERVRAAVDVPFGVAGLTLPGRGAPVPTRLIGAELVRIGAAFTFLRRSFLADLAGRDAAVEVPRMLAADAALRARTPEQVHADRDDLLAAVGGTPAPLQPA
jgi:hypothetical protein